MHIRTLTNPQQAFAVLNGIYEWAKPRLMAGQRLTLTVGEESRNGEQNAKLHACITDISKQVEWAGRKRDTETWKRLLTAAWLRARGESIEVLPALDGHGIDVVFRRTSSLTKAECAELISFVEAWKAEHIPEAECNK